jgi:hypothetical protein
MVIHSQFLGGARGCCWLDEIVSGSVTDVQHIAKRQKYSARQVNMTISLAFLAPDLVRAAVYRAALESSDFVMSRRMEPAIRRTRAESAIVTTAV